MKKDEYINSVLSAFVGRNKSMIKDELEAHLEDRIERFVEMGYTRSQADEMAVEKMGDAQIVGARMTKIHSKKTEMNICFILFFIYVGLAAMLTMTMLAWGSDVCLLSLGAEYFYLLFSVISLLTANRLKSNSAVFVSLLFTFAFIVGKAIFGFHSVLLYGAYFIISGNIDDFIMISQLKNNCITSNILLAFTIVFYSLWIISYVFTLVNLNRFDKLKYSKKDVSRESTYKKSIAAVLLIFTVVTAVLFGFKYYNGYGEYLDGTCDSYYDEVCIIESDEICDIEECYYASESSQQILYKSYDWDTVNASVEGYRLFLYDCIESERAYNRAVNYSFYTLKSRYVNSKKYVAAVPVHFDDDNPIPCFDNAQWYDADKAKEITGSLDRDTDPVQTTDYSIEICNVSAMNDDEAIKYAIGVLDEMDIDYYLGEEEIKRIEGATNSVYIGTGTESIYDYHSFVMNNTIDIHIVLESQNVSYYIDGKLIYEFNYGDNDE